MTSRLQQLHRQGQAVWLDFVDRPLLASGSLKRLIARGDVTGVTSNPTIFEQAMAKGGAYEESLASFLGQIGASAVQIYEAQAIADITAAAAELRDVYERLAGADGYVSLEVSPDVANDTEATLAEARRLWAAIDRPNLMIKIPGTSAGIPAIRRLVEDGININVTLLFSRKAYSAVAEAYLAGLEARAAQCQPVDRIASVASFFVSRIDTQIDATIDARIAQGDPDMSALRAVRGKVAIANAKLSYRDYQLLISGERWRALSGLGAMPQRLLWASTATKDADFPDTLYADSLIGPDTVSTMPPKTLEAFRDHGTVRETLTENIDDAIHILAEAERLGLDLGGVTTGLVGAGILLFAEAMDRLLQAIAARRAAMVGDEFNAAGEKTTRALTDTAYAGRETGPGHLTH